MAERIEFKLPNYTLQEKANPFQTSNHHRNLDYVPNAKGNLSLLCVSVCLQWRYQTALQFVRFRKRINIQRPAPPHYERAKVLKVCEPYYLNPRKGMSLTDLCEKPIEVLPCKEDVVGFYLIC
jgi:hypothetical protein